MERRQEVVCFESLSLLIRNTPSVANSRARQPGILTLISFPPSFFGPRAVEVCGWSETRHPLVPGSFATGLCSLHSISQGNKQPARELQEERCGAFFFFFRSHAKLELENLWRCLCRAVNKKKLYTCLKPSLEACGAFELLWKVSRSGLVPGPRRKQALVGGRGGVNWGRVPPYCEGRASGQHRWQFNSEYFTAQHTACCKQGWAT